MKVARHRDRLDHAGATAVAVTYDEPEQVRALLLDGIEWPYPVAVDLDRARYRAWGLRRASWARIWLDPKVWRQYAQLLASRQRLRGAGKDVRQLGGDFVVAPDGTVAYARPQRRDDRPPAGALANIVEDSSEQQP